MLVDVWVISDVYVPVLVLRCLSSLGLHHFIWLNQGSSQSPQAFPERVTAQARCLRGLGPFSISASQGGRGSCHGCFDSAS